MSHTRIVQKGRRTGIAFASSRLPDMRVGPISFAAPMVMSVLRDDKSMTRRLINPQPPEEVTGCGWYADSKVGRKDEWSWTTGDPEDIDAMAFHSDFKTGYLPGDLLYVREALSLWPGHAEYAADGKRVIEPDEHAREWVATYSRATAPSIHMPRWASRITLEVNAVRVERLQELDHADAIAEGVEHESADPPFYYVPGIYPHNLTAVGVEEPGGRHAERCFAKLWDHLNAKRGFGWETNPWVVVVSFKRHLINIDELLSASAA